MSTKANTFKIGVFVISGITLVIVAIIVLGAGALFEPRTMVEAFFDESVQGLDVGAPIKYRGVQIGTVKEIDIVQHRYPDLPAEVWRQYGHRVVVVGSIRPMPEKTEAARTQEYAAGLRVRLVSQGLTGVVHVEADFVDPRQFPDMTIPWKTKGLYVPSAPSTLTVVGQALSTIAGDLAQANLHDLTQHLDHLIVAGATFIDQIDSKGLRSQTRELLTHADDLIQDTTRLINSPEIKSIMADTRVAIGEIRRAATELSPVSADLRTAGEELPLILGRLDKTARRIDLLTSNRSPDVEKIIENLRLASENVKDLTRNAKRYPSYVLLGDAPPRVNSEK